MINSELRDGEYCYKIQYLKTVKDPKRFVKFIIPKKRDIDIITMVSIVKRVNIIQENSNEYYLSDDTDRVFF